VESVESVFTSALSRSNVCDHDRLTVADKQFTQDLRQFALTVRRVMRLLVYASYTFFQLQTRDNSALKITL